MTTRHQLRITDPAPRHVRAGDAKLLNDDQARAAFRVLLKLADTQPATSLPDALAMAADLVTTNGLTVAPSPTATPPVSSPAAAAAAARVHLHAAQATAKARADRQAAADIAALGLGGTR